MASKIFDFVSEKGSERQGSWNEDSSIHILQEAAKIYQECNAIAFDGHATTGGGFLKSKGKGIMLSARVYFFGLLFFN